MTGRGSTRQLASARLWARRVEQRLHGHNGRRNQRPAISVPRRRLTREAARRATREAAVKRSVAKRLGNNGFDRGMVEGETGGE